MMPGPSPKGVGLRALGLRAQGDDAVSRPTRRPGSKNTKHKEDCGAHVEFCLFRWQVFWVTRRQLIASKARNAHKTPGLQ